MEIARKLWKMTKSPWSFVPQKLSERQIVQFLLDVFLSTIILACMGLVLYT